MEALLLSRAVAPIHRDWMDWAPLLVFTTAALSLRACVPGWMLMWLVTFALFAGFKWWTWRRIMDC